jgi:hypothetical protein
MDKESLKPGPEGQPTETSDENSEVETVAGTEETVSDTEEDLEDED